MELLLHIGVSKTGTSALQRFVFLNHKAIMKSGIYVPIDLLNDENQYRPKMLRQFILDENRTEFDRTIRSIIQQAEKHNCTKILISDESFANIAAPIDCVEWFSDYFKTRLIVYCRRQDLHLESSYGFVVMNNRVTLTFDEWVHNKGLDYMSIIDFYKKKLQPQTVSVISYDFNRKQLFQSFADALGITMDGYILPESEKSNITPNRYIVEIVRILNRFDLDNATRLMILDELSSDASIKAKPKGNYADNSYRRKILLKFRNSNADLYRVYNNGAAFFDDSVEESNSDSLNTLTVERTAAGIINKYRLTNSLRSLLLEILKKLLSYCLLHDLKVYPIAGTLLGIIENQNFLSCEDAIEIAMCEHDYNRLQQLINENPNPFTGMKYVFRKAENADALYLENTMTTIFTVDGQWSEASVCGVHIKIYPCRDTSANAYMDTHYCEFSEKIFGGIMLPVPMKDGKYMDIVTGTLLSQISISALETFRCGTFRLINNTTPYHIYRTKIFDIIEHINERNVTLFGAGFKVADFIADYSYCCNIQSIVDNDRRKQGIPYRELFSLGRDSIQQEHKISDAHMKEVGNIKISSPDSLCNNEDDNIIVITSDAFTEIEKQLSEYSVDNYCIYIKSMKR